MATLRLKVQIANLADFERLCEAAALLVDMAEDMPWRPELREKAEEMTSILSRIEIAQ